MSGDGSTPPKKGHARKASFLPSFLVSGGKEDDAAASSPDKPTSTHSSPSLTASPSDSASRTSKDGPPSPIALKRKGHARSQSLFGTVTSSVVGAITSTSDTVTSLIPGMSGSTDGVPEVEVTFHSDEPPPPPVLPEDDTLAQPQRLRNKVINEIITTEHLYSRDLERIQEVFMNPMKEQKLLDAAQMNTVFGGLSILLGVSRQMAKDLELQAKSNGCIGSCFQGLAPYLKIYSQYCTNQQVSIETLTKQSLANGKLKTFLEEKQFSKQCGGQPLASYLSKPTQRLCKYPLLLRELLKNTPPAHSDRSPVEEAARQIDVVVKSVNEARRRIEQSQVIYAIQAKLDTTELHLLTPTRVFYKEVPLRELVAGDNFSDVTFLLFNDLLLICKAAGKKLSVASSYPTSKLTCTLLDENATAARLRNSFEVVILGHTSTRRIFFATSEELRAQTLAELQRAIASEATEPESAEGSVKEDGSHSSVATDTDSTTTSGSGSDITKPRVPPAIPPKPQRTKPKDPKRLSQG